MTDEHTPDQAGGFDVQAKSRHFDIVRVSATRIARFFGYTLNIEMKRAAGREPLVAHVVGLPAKNRLDLTPVTARQATGRSCARLSEILAACREDPDTWGAVMGAVNGGYFVFIERLACRARNFQPRHTRVGDPVGLFATNGRIVGLPLYGRAALMRDASGAWRMARPTLRDIAVILHPPGRGAPVHIIPEIINDPAAPAHCVAAFTPAFGKSAPGAPNTACLSFIGDKLVSARARGPAPVPVNGAVLRVPLALLDSAPFADLKNGCAAEYAMSPHGMDRLGHVHQALECGPRLVRGGQVADVTPEFLADQGFAPGTPPFPAFNSVLTHYKILAPRMVVGLNEKNDLFLLLFEGRQPGVSQGVTLGEAAILARALGCTEALNLDGGASAQIILGSESLNVPQLGEGQAWMKKALALLNRAATPGTLPAPGDLGDGAERTIGDALLIVARP